MGVRSKTVMIGRKTKCQDLMAALMWNIGLWKSYDKSHSGLPIKTQDSGRERFGYR